MQQPLKQLLKSLVIVEATRFKRETGQNLSRWRQKLYQYENMGGYFVHFSSVPRLGLFLRNKHGTPIGFYAYPLDLAEISGFATERPYAVVFRPKQDARILEMSAYTEADLKADTRKLRSWGYSPQAITDAVSKAKIPTPGGRIWNITRVLSGADKIKDYIDKAKVSFEPDSNLPDRGGGPTGKWTMLLRRLGYDGVIDEGDSIIHEAEPAQAVFFDTTKLDLIEVIEKEEGTENGPPLSALLDPERHQGEADFSGRYLQGKNFSYSMFAKANFSNADLTSVEFEGANLSLSNFEGANLTDAGMYKTKLMRANLNGADLTRARVSDANLKDASLSGATLNRTTFAASMLVGADFTDADAAEAYFKDSNVKGARFDGANLHYASFTRAIATGTSFQRANLEGANFLATTLDGADFRGANLQDAEFERAFLVGADFTGATFDETTFKGAAYDKTTKFPEGFDPKKAMMSYYEP